MPERVLIVRSRGKLHELVEHHVKAQLPGCLVETVDNVQDGEFQLVSQGEYALVLLTNTDIISARSRAREALVPLQFLRQASPLVPIVMIGAGGSELLAAESIRQGASDYLPVELVGSEEFVDVLRQEIPGAFAEQSPPSLMASSPAAQDEVLPPAMAPQGFCASSNGPISETAPPTCDLPMPSVEGYRVIRRVGAGATSSAFLAHCRSLDRRVVLKIVAGVGDADGQQMQSFEREYRVIYKLRHRSIVQIHDWGRCDEGAYIAVEYIPGGDLGQRMRGPMAAAEALRYVDKIAQALAVIHERGIFHRDLKPANVMLREDNSIALIDFGLATLQGSQTTLAGDGIVLGTPAYLSPEQARGERVDARSDIYSLGALLFEMLTGQKPYSARTVMHMVAQHAKGPVPTLPEHLAALQPLLERMMAKQTDQRFRDTEQLLRTVHRVRRALSGAPPKVRMLGNE